jgi:hypothetical protein
VISRRSASAGCRRRGPPTRCRGTRRAWRSR